MDYKFRGKLLYSGLWVYGSLYTYDDKAEIADTSRIGHPFMGVDPTTVGMFTGLRDVHGRAIYKGDVVKALSDAGDSWIGEIVYDDSCGQYDLKEHSTRRNNEQPLYMFDQLEVIGNISDNPDLLSTTRGEA